ncbi:hypothetical protein ABH309_19015 [Chromobacterium piscinae]|uniref:Effector protein BipC n=1 Tax=Chromobacterium piscinae TaxID=686831 RepID=A0ABV0H9C9_9NEIS
MDILNIRPNPASVYPGIAESQGRGAHENGQRVVVHANTWFEVVSAQLAATPPSPVENRASTPVVAAAPSAPQSAQFMPGLLSNKLTIVLKNLFEAIRAGALERAKNEQKMSLLANDIHRLIRDSRKTAAANELNGALAKNVAQIVTTGIGVGTGIGGIAKSTKANKMQFEHDVKLRDANVVSGDLDLARKALDKQITAMHAKLDKGWNSSDVLDDGQIKLTPKKTDFTRESPIGVTSSPKDYTREYRPDLPSVEQQGALLRDGEAVLRRVAADVDKTVPYNMTANLKDNIDKVEALAKEKPIADETIAELARNAPEHTKQVSALTTKAERMKLVGNALTMTSSVAGMITSANFTQQSQIRQAEAAYNDTTAQTLQTLGQANAEAKQQAEAQLSSVLENLRTVQQHMNAVIDAAK